MRPIRDMSERGVSVVELLIVISLLATVVIIIASPFRGTHQIWEVGDRKAEVTQNAIIGMDKMTRELKQAWGIISVSSPSVTSGYIEFIDRDGSTVRRFQCNEGYLEYGTPGVMNRLAGPITSLTFACYQDNGIVQTIAPDEIKSVKIQMNTSDSEGKVASVPLSSLVSVRNDLDLGAGDYAIFAVGDITLENNTAILGNVGTDGNLSLKNNAGITGNAIIDDNVTLDNNTDVTGNLCTNGNVTMTNGATVGGYIEHAGTLTGTGYGSHFTGHVSRRWFTDVLPPVNSFTAGSGVTQVSGHMALAPGTYGDLKVGNNDILDLSAGDYYFKSVTIGNSATLNFNLSGGGIRIFVVGGVTINNGMSCSLNGGDASKIYVETHGSWYCKNNKAAGERWYGTIYAPYGDITFKNSAGMEGALYSGGNILLSNNGTLSFVRSAYI